MVRAMPVVQISHTFHRFAFESLTSAELAYAHLGRGLSARWTIELFRDSYDGGLIRQRAACKQKFCVGKAFSRRTGSPEYGSASESQAS